MHKLLIPKYVRDELRRQKVGMQNPWHQAKHMKLLSNLLVLQDAQAINPPMWKGASNELRRQKVDMQNLWQQAKHVKLLSNLLQGAQATNC